MDLILGKIFFDTNLLKCSESFKTNILLFDSPQRNKAMVKPNDKRQKIVDNLLLFDNHNILRKELKLLTHEKSVDVTYLKIQNNSGFVLQPKDKANKIISNKYYLKQSTTPVNLEDDISKSEAKEDIIREIIDIKCKHKTSDALNMESKTKYISEKSSTDKSQLTTNSPNNQVFTNDIKSDLQSLLILMAISNTCNENDKKNHTIQNHSGIYIDDDKQITSTRSLEELNTSCDMSNLLKIDAFKITTCDKSIILRKYAQKWMDYVKKQREKNSQCERLANINKFLNKLEKKKVSMNVDIDTVNKAKLQARDYNTYQHRYKVQKHIIALQKAKLEQQNKLIEELKYNKLIETSRQSLDNMKENVKQTYYDIDKHLKPKIKCLTNELKIRDIEDNSLILHCLKVPQFLQRMEARAREREEKHAIIRERRKQMEEDRIRLKQQAEIAKAEMDKEEKLKRIKELREKRKKEKIDNIRKKQYTERLRALIVMADLHYEKSLTAKYGIRPLKLLIQLKRDNIEKAKAHYIFQLKKNIFLHWMWHTEDMWYERNYKADEFRRKKLLRNGFDCLKKNHNEYMIKMQVAIDYYDLYITQLVFRGFQEGLLILKKEFTKKWTNAIIYYNSNLLFKTLTCWRTLPALNALKREQDARKQRWREKVLQVVPDYEPPEE